MSDQSRLIEHAFPLKQASLDSVHEKNVRHGHISTLHIWPARRPLAACRAALIATLLPDPGDPEKRRELCEKIGGTAIKRPDRKKMPDGRIIEREKEETVGGILHWGRETENKDLLDWFRQEIKKAYGGRAPKVLDPFAGGGAIPLEAMRLGCEATAVDINPVAWFILKCTLEYPQKLAGKTHPLPAFILKNKGFMTAFMKAHPQYAGLSAPEKKARKDSPSKPPINGLFDKCRGGAGQIPEADLAWHVRAWGQWVLDHARRDLARFYPTYADFESLDQKDYHPYEKQPMMLVPLNEDGTPDIDSLNRDFSEEYLADRTNPRWVVKPTVAYLWARTIICKHCRATVPILKTRWLARTNSQRTILEIKPNKDKSGVVLSIVEGVPRVGSNNAQKRENDKQIGLGTITKSGVKCPCCNTIITMQDIQLDGNSGRLGQMITAVAIDGEKRKEFRTATNLDLPEDKEIESAISDVYKTIPLGIPDEKIAEDAKRSTWCVNYGFITFDKLFTRRQLLAIGILISIIRSAKNELRNSGYPVEWIEAIYCYLSCCLNRLSDYLNTGAQWKLDRATINHLFVRNSIPISWDFAEGNALGNFPGSFEICLRKITVALDTYKQWSIDASKIAIINTSSVSLTKEEPVDIILTDPPYYNSISYSVIMDYFYVWLRRLLHDMNTDFDKVFHEPLSPKWNNEQNDGELVDDASRHDGDAVLSKRVYEEGMAQVFARCNQILYDQGHLVVVFAHKDPIAWEALVSAIIKSGFLVDSSWPIQTEQTSRMRAQSSSALASSIWLVCKKRLFNSRPGWDNQVLAEMRRNIQQRLREFWDAGIRGPDFVWAATGPALEAYSKHPVVRKANEPGLMTVNEFLTHVRKMVVDFVVGRVLSGDAADQDDPADTERLDEPTTYYLLHRHDFGFEEAPAGACILYAVSCGLSDRELAGTWDLISFTQGKMADDERESEEPDADAEGDLDAEEESGSKVRLKSWVQRKSRNLGYEVPGGRQVPLIDRVHCLMHLWRDGDRAKVDEYLDENALRRREIFKRLIQALIEQSPRGSEERSLLESLSNHIQAKGAIKGPGKLALGGAAKEE